MKKIFNKISGIILILVAVFAWCVYSFEQSEASILTNSSVVSNTKIGWGVKRADNHEQPDLRKNKHRTNGKI